jgi:hypothetical protein
MNIYGLGEISIGTFPPENEELLIRLAAKEWLAAN